MVTFFCPYCWREVSEETTQCPHCGANIQAFARLSYAQKLMHALNHPVRETRLLAIRLLGRLRTAAALPHFERLLKTEKDVYVLLEILQALSLMNTPESQKLLTQTAVSHQTERVRRQAQRLLAQSQK